ncbi:MAG: SlyX family protein [Rhodobacteraceae bacterium]|nr:SlyX family protein [Paracoccaceae bacterium]
MTNRLTNLEEHATHQAVTLEELSAVVAAQAEQIGRLERRVRLLMERAAQMETDTMSGAPLTTQKPPHW